MLQTNSSSNFRDSSIIRYPVPHRFSVQDNSECIPLPAWEIPHLQIEHNHNRILEHAHIRILERE